MDFRVIKTFQLLFVFTLFKTQLSLLVMRLIKLIKVIFLFLDLGLLLLSPKRPILKMKRMASLLDNI